MQNRPQNNPLPFSLPYVAAGRPHRRAPPPLRRSPLRSTCTASFAVAASPSSRTIACRGAAESPESMPACPQVAAASRTQCARRSREHGGDGELT